MGAARSWYGSGMLVRIEFHKISNISVKATFYAATRPARAHVADAAVLNFLLVSCVHFGRARAAHAFAVTEASAILILALFFHSIR